VRWKDAFVLAARGSSRRAVRTVLTTLGVVLGSALLVALALITSSADTKVIDRLGQGGPVSVIKVAAASPQLDQLQSDTLRIASPRDLTDANLTDMRRLPHVSRVIPVLGGQVTALPPKTGSVFGTMVGTDLSQQGSLPITLLAGRLPAASSLTEVAVTPDYLDQAHIDNRHPAAALGTEIAFSYSRGERQGQARVRRWFRARVVGVVAQEVADGDFLVPIEQTRVIRQWAIGGSPDPRQPLPVSPYTGAVVVADSLNDVHEIRQEITVLGYATSAPEHLVASVQKYLGIVNIVLGSIGSVALVVALLSIANALLAAIHERRRDIGVLKAIGGRDRDVLRWFLIEALGMGLVGGAAGAVVGVAIAEVVGVIVNRYLVSQGLERIDLIGLPVVIPLAGWAGTGVLAIVAGALPAMRAAHLPAREAVVEG
jgi:putative ABC transport system permease protein